MQLLTEKGNHIKVRRQLEQITSEQSLLLADSTQLRDAVVELTSNSESFAAREMELNAATDQLSAELRAVTIERDRLMRDMDDRRVRDAAIQDNIEVCVMTHH